MLYYDYYFTFYKVRQKLNHFCLILFVILELLSSNSHPTTKLPINFVAANLQTRLYETPSPSAPNSVSSSSSSSSSAVSLPVDSIQTGQQVQVVGQVLQQEQKCQPVNTELCNIEKYSTLQPFNNTLGHTSISSAIAELHKYAYLFNKEQCKRNIQLFLCSLYTPVCVNNQSLEPKLINNILLPCRDICESAKLACLKHLKAAKEDWPSEWTCGKFKYYTEDKLCVINNTNDTNNNYYNNNNPEDAQYQNHSNTTAESQDSDLDLPIDTAIDSQQLGVASGHRNDVLLSTTTNTPLKCSDDEFDCKLRDFHTKGMHLFCIDKSLVCDGRKDCLRNDTFGGIGSDEGLDEANCEVKCSESELICDNKCITKQDICNGFVDCSSGADESNCYDHVSGVIQSIVCISGLFFSIYFLIQCFRLDSQQKTTTTTSEEHFSNDDSHNNSMEEQHYTTTGIENFDINHLQRKNDQNDIIQSNINLNGLQQTIVGIPAHHHHHHHNLRQTLDQEEINQHFSARNSMSARFPIYQEPAYSIATRSDYERLNTGGYSGASSVCMYSAAGGLYQSSTTLPPMLTQSLRCHYDYDNAPAPPPTPALQSIYSTGSITKLADLYVNLNSPHKTDLLD